MALNLSDGFNPAIDAAAAEHDLPIFTVERVQMDFSVTADFVAAQVANNVMVLALSNGRILRIDLNRPEDIDGTASRALSAIELPLTFCRY
jgi:hypothetical protein